MAFYVESVDRPSRSGIVAEDIEVGTAVAYDGSNNFVKLDASTHSQADFAGVADFHHTGEAISVDEDDNSYGVFESAEDDRASAWGDEDGGVIKLRTLPDNGTDPAVDISNGDVVGVANVTDGDGYLVEEGYTDNGGTTYGRSSTGDFVALGVADRDSSTSFDDPVRVQVNKGV